MEQNLCGYYRPIQIFNKDSYKQAVTVKTNTGNCFREIIRDR